MISKGVSRFLKSICYGTDLRSYLDLIKQNHPEDFLVVSREVDPAFEITAITVKLEQEAKRRPILLFEKVKGTKFPVLTNLHAGRARLAAAIHAKPEEMQRAYLRAMENPIPPKMVSTGPAKEVILTGDGIDLYKLPQILHHQEDAGPLYHGRHFICQRPEQRPLELRL